MTSTGTPVGYRFLPTDEELVDHYLRLKMQGYDHIVSKIAEVNVCDHEPWNLPKYSEIKSNDPQWHFFSRRNYKYNKSNSSRANRTTKAGYWKVTGKERKIVNKDSGEQIGKKKTLVFYKGRIPNGVKTNWVMHEYNATFNVPNQRDFVLFKLRTDVDDMPSFEEGDSSCQDDPDPNQDGTEPQREEDSLQMGAYLQSFNGCDEMDYNLNAALQFKY